MSDCGFLLFVRDAVTVFVLIASSSCQLPEYLWKEMQEIPQWSGLSENGYTRSLTSWSVVELVMSRNVWGFLLIASHGSSNDSPFICSVCSDVWQQLTWAEGLRWLSARECLCVCLCVWDRKLHTRSITTDRWINRLSVCVITGFFQWNRTSDSCQRHTTVWPHSLIKGRHDHTQHRLIYSSGAVPFLHFF